MEEIGLTAYLDVLGQPAVVLTSPVSATSELCKAKALVACHVNDRFRELMSEAGESPGAIATTNLVGIQFVSILQGHSASPSTSRFLEWIDGIKQSSERNSHFLKSVFRKSAPDENASSVVKTPEFAEIEWNSSKEI